MASVQADGGLVSSVDDSLVFLRAFFGGQLFSLAILAEIQAQWRSIFFPLTYGTGVMRFALPWILTLFRRFPPVVGHSGASGALMFYCPEWDLYVAGTVNQVQQRSQSFQLMIKALDIARRPADGN
jgi:CubicO group peptidase (beta-lactamase class C family)